MDALGGEEFHQRVGNLVVIADHGSAATKDGGNLAFPHGTAAIHDLFVFRAVPEDFLIVHGKIHIPLGIDEAGIPQMALEVVVLEEAGNTRVALGCEVFHQLPSAVIVVVQNGHRAFQIPVTAVEEDQGDIPGLELPVQVQMLIPVAVQHSQHTPRI